MGVMEARRRIMLNQPHLVSAQGNPISFNTDMAAKLGECKAHFEPVQSGTGDPSPSNVRPISGWTGCTVSHSGADTSNPTTYPVTFPAVGKNLLNPNNLVKGSITLSDGVFTGTAANFKSAFGTSPGVLSGFKTGTQYSITVTARKDEDSYGSGNGLIIRAFYDNHEYSSITFPNSTTSYATKTLTTANGRNVTWIVILYASGGPSTWHIKDFQVEEGSTATTYEPFTNTIYGGYVDLERGEVVAEYKMLNFLWSQGTNTSSTFVNVERRKFVTSGCKDSNTKNNQMCNVAPFAYSYSGSNADVVHWYCGGNNSYLFLPIGTDEDTSIQLCCLLATPITYPITPQLIKTLKGQNTIWSDTNGNIDLKYWKH